MAFVMILLLATSAWVISGFSFSADEVYDLRGGAQPSDVTRGVKGWLANLILPIVYDEKTRYAPGYSEVAFDALSYGSTEGDVLKALGPPLSRREISGDRVILHYSEQLSQTDNYLVRNLVFDAGGRLIDRRRYFYVD